MKLRHPWLLAVAAFVGAWVVRLWFRTVRCRTVALGAPLVPTHPECRGPYLYAFWHEVLLLPSYNYGGTGSRALVSGHADGRLIGGILRRLRHEPIYGSSTRGGVEALLRLLRSGGGHVVVTPDGPRGPRRRVQPGVIFLAARTGLPIVPVGFAFDRPWRARSWDRFAVPRPFSRAVALTADVLVVPPDADRDERERYRLLLEEQIHRLTDEAERLVATPGAEPRRDGGTAEARAA